jgi:hypothetical protein
MALTTPFRIAASAEIGNSGKRKHVYSIHLAAGAGAAGRALFHNGTGAGDPTLYELAAIAGGGDGQSFEGAIFDKGLFVEITGAGAIASGETVEL